MWNLQCAHSFRLYEPVVSHVISGETVARRFAQSDLDEKLLSFARSFMTSVARLPHVQASGSTTTAELTRLADDTLRSSCAAVCA